MKTPQEELESHVNQIIYYLNTEKKIIAPQRVWLLKVMDTMIHSRQFNEEDIKILELYLSMEKPTQSLTIYSKLLHDINALAKWVVNNPKTSIEPKAINRYLAINERIKNAEDFSKEETDRMSDLATSEDVH